MRKHLNIRFLTKNGVDLYSVAIQKIDMAIILFGLNQGNLMKIMEKNDGI